MALYKHKALKNDSLVFEWVSDNPDPIATNPYPTEYGELIFSTEAPSKFDEDLFNRDLSAKNDLETLKTLFQGVMNFDIANATTAQLKTYLVDERRLLRAVCLMLRKLT